MTGRSTGRIRAVLPSKPLMAFGSLFNARSTGRIRTALPSLPMIVLGSGLTGRSPGRSRTVSSRTRRVLPVGAVESMSVPNVCCFPGGTTFMVVLPSWCVIAGRPDLSTRREEFPIHQVVVERYRDYLEHWQVPTRSRQIATRHGETFVVACGSDNAPPVVLLHAARSQALSAPTRPAADFR